MIAAIKIGTIIGWLAILANVVMPFGGQIEVILNWSGIGLLVAHALEAIIYLPTINRVGGNKAGHIAQVIIFGVGHFLSMQSMLKPQQA
jgi:uncharacterized protein YhhL (DUF1145 family)